MCSTKSLWGVNWPKTLASKIQLLKLYIYAQKESLLVGTKSK